jgi:hypothetical protein
MPTAVSEVIQTSSVGMDGWIQVIEAEEDKEENMGGN